MAASVTKSSCKSAVRPTSLYQTVAVHYWMIHRKWFLATHSNSWEYQLLDRERRGTLCSVQILGAGVWGSMLGSENTIMWHAESWVAWKWTISTPVNKQNDRVLRSHSFNKPLVQVHPVIGARISIVQCNPCQWSNKIRLKHSMSELICPWRM